MTETRREPLPVPERDWVSEDLEHLAALPPDERVWLPVRRVWLGDGRTGA